eukprot:GGOE01025454.1.p1 GENE.GGOE01025454.1~~GGOE01025454.1.p1  ORF type:complete len:500 (+),score=30.17 GGOE01025454.1:136-1635(+)
MFASFVPSWVQPIRESSWKTSDVSCRLCPIPTQDVPRAMQAASSRPASAQAPTSQPLIPQRVRPSTAGSLRTQVQSALQLPLTPPTRGIRHLRELRERQNQAIATEVASQPGAVPSSWNTPLAQEGAVSTTILNAPFGRAVSADGPVFLPERDSLLFRQAVSRFCAAEGLSVAEHHVHLEGLLGTGTTQTLVRWSVQDVPAPVLAAAQRLLARGDRDACLERHFAVVGLCQPMSPTVTATDPLPLCPSATPGAVPDPEPLSLRPPSASSDRKRTVVVEGEVGERNARLLPRTSRRALRSLFAGPRCISPKLRRIRRAQWGSIGDDPSEDNNDPHTCHRRSIESSTGSAPPGAREPPNQPRPSIATFSLPVADSGPLPAAPTSTCPEAGRLKGLVEQPTAQPRWQQGPASPGSLLAARNDQARDAGVVSGGRQDQTMGGDGTHGAALTASIKGWQAMPTVPAVTGAPAAACTDPARGRLPSTATRGTFPVPQQQACGAGN